MLGIETRLGLIVAATLIVVGCANTSTEDSSQGKASVPEAQSTSAKVESGETNQQQAEIDDPIICRTEAQTGSRFKKRRCAPRSEWSRLTEASEDFLQEFERVNRQGS